MCDVTERKATKRTNIAERKRSRMDKNGMLFESGEKSMGKWREREKIKDKSDFF